MQRSASLSFADEGDSPTSPTASRRFGSGRPAVSGVIFLASDFGAQLHAELAAAPHRARALEAEHGRALGVPPALAPLPWGAARAGAAPLLSLIHI